MEGLSTSGLTLMNGWQNHGTALRWVHLVLLFVVSVFFFFPLVHSCGFK